MKDSDDRARRNWFSGHITPFDAVTVALIGLLLAGASILAVVFMPHQHLALLFILAILVAALRSSPRVVAITTVVTVVLVLMDIVLDDETMKVWPYWVATITVTCFLAMTVSRQRRRERQRACEAELSADQMTRLYTVAIALAAAATPAQVAEVVVSHAATIGARAGSIAILSTNPDELQLAASSGFATEILEPWQRFPVTSQTPVAEAIRENIPLWFSSTAEFYERYPAFLLWRGPHCDKAWAAMPLRLGDRVIGGLLLAFREERMFAKDDQTLILSFAAQCAQALDRARLYDIEHQARVESEQARLAVERAMDHTTRLQAVTAALSEALSPHDVARAIVDEVIEALGARSGLLSLITSNGSMYEIVYDQGYPPNLLDQVRHVPISSSGPFAESFRTTGVIVCHTLADRIRTWPHLTAMHNQLGSGPIMALPLTIDGQTIGSLALGFPETRSLVEDDVNFAVTLAHLAAQALQRSRLYEAEKVMVRQRDEFLTVAAHELKTPMTSLRGFAQIELLRNRGGEVTSPEQTRRSLEVIDFQATKLSDMIARLFDVAQIDTGKLVLHRRIVNLTEVIEETIRTFPASGHPIAVDAVLTTPTAIDPLRIEQVVTNLLDNAVKYTPEGTVVEVQVSRPSDDVVRMAIRDHGTGIAPARRGHIFERYYRADDENYRSGMGLGLYICRQIVELHGGQMWAEFPDDGGTRIIVILPAV